MFMIGMDRGAMDCRLQFLDQFKPPLVDVIDSFPQLSFAAGEPIPCFDRSMMFVASLPMVERAADCTQIMAELGQRLLECGLFGLACFCAQLFRGSIPF
jgi:hypothetical protein